MPGIIRSIKFIVKNRHQNSFFGITKYFIWQIIRLLNSFPRIITFSNSKILILDKNIANQGGTKLYTCGSYDSDNMPFIKDIMNIYKNGFYDIGANLGVYTIYISELSDVQCVSIEPHPYTYNCLLINQYLNNRRNITSYNIAVGDCTASVKFSDVPGSSINKVMGDKTDLNPYIFVKQRILKDIISETQITPSVIKIDTEGYEYPVLSGIKEYLKDIKILVLEITENIAEISKLLDEYFTGPFYIDYKNKKLNKNQYYNEDPVFINKLNFSEIMTNLGFSY
jgi:FkbM family methyltransferase